MNKPQQEPKTIHDFAALLARVEFGNWQFHVLMDGDRPYLQLRFKACCSVTGHQLHQHGRKWFLSPFMTDSEVIATAFKATMTAMEHETRERFLFKGKKIFGPHIDVDALWEVADRTDDRHQPPTAQGASCPLSPAI